MPFYAVARGREVGVYGSWDECRQRVDRFPRARYKKFPTSKEAWAFISEVLEGDAAPSRPRRESRKRSHSTLAGDDRSDEDEDDALELLYKNKGSKATLEAPAAKRRHLQPAVAYVDGACQHNGNRGGEACAGYGVHWPNGECPDVREMLVGEKQTNQRAELTASCCALEQARERGLGAVEVRTDSMYTLKGASQWLKKWRSNGWRTTGDSDVKNRDLWQRLDGLLTDVDVKWTHVRGHRGIVGNERADFLARQGAEKRRLRLTQ